MRAMIATLTLSVKCPLEIETATLWEGCYWVECGCDIEVEIEYGSDVHEGWRVGRAPSGCPLNPYQTPYTEGEKRVLAQRITDAWERYVDNQETPVYERSA